MDVGANACGAESTTLHVNSFLYSSDNMQVLPTFTCFTDVTALQVAKVMLAADYVRVTLLFQMSCNGQHVNQKRAQVTRMIPFIARLILHRVNHRMTLLSTVLAKTGRVGIR